jgi:hypothetical protein
MSGQFGSHYYKVGMKFRMTPSVDRFPSRFMAMIGVAAFAACVGASSLLWAQEDESAKHGSPPPTSNPEAQRGFSPCVDSAGNISLPHDFETTFVHIGTISVAPKATDPANELHSTYTRPEDLAAFQRDGRFPDGAVLVKEVRATNSAPMTTGSATFGAEMKVWFVMVKDAKGRFEKNELWGDGWGWALFEGDDRTEQVAVDYKTDCRTCHVPARKNDWLFTECYPALHLHAKEAGLEGGGSP